MDILGLNIQKKKDKSDTRKRSVSESVTLKFILNKRSFDKPTSSSMKHFMESLALFYLVILQVILIIETQKYYV